jgi:opacity protein-like surface antigen
MSYLTVPIDVRLKYPGVPFLHPYILAGINTAFLVDGMIKDTTNAPGLGIATSVDTNVIKSKDIKKIDFGLDVGAGVEVPVAMLIPYVEFTCYLGLTNINATSAGSATKVTGIEVKAGIKYKI